MSERKLSQMLEGVISKPIYRILADLTPESRLEVPLPIAVKDLVRLKLKEAWEREEEFEQRYGVDFEAFKQAWGEGGITDKYSYGVERDYRECEAAVTDEEQLSEMLGSLL